MVHRAMASEAIANERVMRERRVRRGFMVAPLGRCPRWRQKVAATRVGLYSLYVRLCNWRVEERSLAPIEMMQKNEKQIPRYARDDNGWLLEQNDGSRKAIDCAQDGPGLQTTGDCSRRHPTRAHIRAKRKGVG